MTKVAHSVYEPFKNGLDLSDAVFFLLVENINNPRSVLFVYLFLQQIVFLLLELEGIVELFVLILHLLSHELQQIVTLLSCFAQVDRRKIFFVVFDALQFLYASFKKLYLFDVG